VSHILTALRSCHLMYWVNLKWSRLGQSGCNGRDNRIKSQHCRAVYTTINSPAHRLHILAAACMYPTFHPLWKGKTKTKWDQLCHRSRLTSVVGWLRPRTGSHLKMSLHWSNELDSLCHDDTCTSNILDITIIKCQHSWHELFTKWE